MEKPESAAANSDLQYDKSFIQPSVEKFEQDYSEDNKKEGSLSSSLVSNGCVDFRGNVANKQKTGGWKASPYIIVNEIAERLAFFAIAVNMVAYLAASNHNYFLLCFAVGMVLLTVSASEDSLRPPPCKARPCNKATDGQTWFLYAALGLIALGTGGIKPCVSSFGADQFDGADTHEVQKKYSFFNWFFFSINMGALLGITLLFTYKTRKGGLGVSESQQWPWFVQVIVVSMRNHSKGVEVGHEAVLYEVTTEESDIVGARKLPHTEQYRFLDKAAVVTDIEDYPKNRWSYAQ
ncbi:hypothetical protein M0R45_012440 [Rubus argutus]|uniref:Uncharacterized protein n=1 Tax=Rubus argutus TaxID=59490 RepID=A0AAW1YD82_RUBAR